MTTIEMTTSGAAVAGTTTAQRILALNWRCLRHPQAGGSEINLFEQARLWAEGGYEVTVLTADPGREHAPEREEQQSDGVTVLRMGGRFSVYLLVALYLLLNFRRFDRIVDVANGIPFFTPLFTPTPSVLLVHHVHGEQWHREFPRPIAAVGWFIESKLVPMIYRRRQIIAVSPTTRDALVELGFASSQIEIVYNGVERPAAMPDRLLRDQRRIVYVGRLKRYKRLDRLVRSVAALRHTYPDVQLDLAGDGDARPELEQLIDELGVRDSVTVHGFVDDATKSRLLSSATVFATPSMHEGWGLSVIEANAYGCPAVAYDVPGLRVAIRHDETGLLADDDKGFEQALLSVLQNADLRERLSDGAERWAANFSWETCARSTLQVLQTCA